MENQHRLITGYRELTAEEIALMNEIKASGMVLHGVVEKIRAAIDRQHQAAQTDAEYLRLDNADPMTWLEEGMYDLQVGLMKLTRAVAQPTTF